MAEVAEVARVSLATADRVLNRRKGVSERTRNRVLKAAVEIGFLTADAVDRLTAERPPNISVLLPAGTNPYLRMLGDRVRERAARAGPDSPALRCLFIDSFNADALASALRRQSGWADGIAFMAIDHPAVRAAVEDVAGQGVRIVTILSDLPHPARSFYVGLDNQMAGRTAGLLMGRFSRRPEGRVALVAGSRNYRAHSEREAGFLALLDEQFPGLRPVGMLEGHDSAIENYRHAIALLEHTPDLVGVYNVGGSSDGIARALLEKGMAENLILIGHGLTADTRRMLIEGTMDAVIDSDPDSVLDRAIRAISHPEAEEGESGVKMDIFLRENLPPLRIQRSARGSAAE